jgi:hypothetical protein
MSKLHPDFFIFFIFFLIRVSLRGPTRIGRILTKHQTMEKERAFDRLATVSKMLMDVRVVELRKRNEELELELFWIKHSIHRLRKAMKNANHGWIRFPIQSPACDCWKCHVSKRIGKRQVFDKNKTCEFIPWFEALLTECGMTYEGDPAPHDHTHHISHPNGRVCNIDSHFVETTMGGGFMCMLTYGAR